MIGRPEPTREAVLAAYRRAAAVAPIAQPPPRPRTTSGPVIARSVAPAQVPAHPLSESPFAHLQRVVDLQPAPADGAQMRSSADPRPQTPNLDELADYVLERLRDELRDGRERLGFLLEDSS